MTDVSVVTSPFLGIKEGHTNAEQVIRVEGRQFRKAGTSPGVRREGEVAVQSSVYTGFLLVQERVAQVRDPAMRWSPRGCNFPGSGEFPGSRTSRFPPRKWAECLGPWEGGGARP